VVSEVYSELKQTKRALSVKCSTALRFMNVQLFTNFRVNTYKIKTQDKPCVCASPNRHPLYCVYSHFAVSRYPN